MLNLYTFVNDVFLATLIPGFLITIWLTGLITIGTLKICLIGSIILFVIIPFIFKYSLKLQQGILFLTFIARPSNTLFTSLEDVGLHGTRNFYVTHRDQDEEIRLGVWHILPNYITKRFSKELNLSEASIIELSETKSHPKQEEALSLSEGSIRASFPEINQENEKQFYEQMLRTPLSSVVLYLHGNTGSRGAAHRIEMYKLLREEGHHVIAVDYRGYADSSPIAPNEHGVVNDAIAVYSYITEVTRAPVFLWGHSLGTGVSTHMLAKMQKRNVFGPRLVILESPFNNIREEVRAHPFARIFKRLPWFNYTIVDPMYQNELRFESDKHIAEFRQPVMILHAEDDLVVPFKLGYKLFRTALDTRPKSWGPIEFHRFEANSSFGHKWLCKSEALREYVRNFIQNYQNETY